MGCVSSAFLDDDDDRRRIIGVSAASHHHIVSLTSSTYGILTGPRAYSSSSTAHPPPQPPPPPPPPPAAIISTTRTTQSQPPPPDEVINSWELMAGLLDPSTPAKNTPNHCRPHPLPHPNNKDYYYYSSLPSGNRDRHRCIRFPLRPIHGNSSSGSAVAKPPNPRCPPGSAVVLYTTSLRGVRATFEACNAVRAALQAHGVAFLERDVSMDRGFREELRELLGCGGVGKPALLPRLFVRGRHVGGAEEVLRMDEEGALAALLEGLPKARGGSYCCDGCGGMRFLPCFDCSGSRKVAVSLPPQASGRKKAGGAMVVRCRECNENGLVLCPICS
uniref:Glutaredoxin domain-containing protein n=1 Tax=Arundo donax TaxID=35708 RepID=A0A0A9G141_ARUDO